MNQLFVRPNRSFVQVGLRRVLTAAIVVVSLFALARPGLAADATPPEVPANLAVPPGNVLVRVGHATGTQNYVCLSSGEGVTFTLFTPQATLFDAEGGQIMTHFFGPNPIENGTTRAAWQDSKDTSTVWGKVQASSTDPAYVAPGAIPWLLVAVVGNQNGPTGGDRLAQTTFIQRVHTAGGMAPSTGCSSPADVGNRAYVPYVTDYYFFRAKGN